MIEDFLRSNKSQEKYVQEHNICRATLLVWSRRLDISLSDRVRYPKAEKGPPLPMSFIDILFKNAASYQPCWLG